MSSRASASSYVAPAQVEETLRPGWLCRLADYSEMTKPRIMVMALVAVTVGYIFGSRAAGDASTWIAMLIGIAMVAASCSMLNQYIERSSDARMQRTSGRPLPAGRLSAGEVLTVGLLLAGLGLGLIAWRVNLLTAGLSAGTLIGYVAVYTPLKPRTVLCTTVGAIPGAMPPVLGWTAASGELELGAALLFAILFVWQFPHFLAIAWLYRNDYERAALKMLPTGQYAARTTGLLCTAYAAVLLPISLLPSQHQMAGERYFALAVILGLGYLCCAIRFLLRGHNESARGLLWSSLIYLPMLLLTLTWDYLQLMQ